MLKTISVALAGAAIIATPTMAAAAPANPAASLSVAKSVRASAPGGKEKLASAGILVSVAATAAVIAAVLLIADKDIAEQPTADSN